MLLDHMPLLLQTCKHKHKDKRKRKPQTANCIAHGNLDQKRRLQYSAVRCSVRRLPMGLQWRSGCGMRMRMQK
jgi:hypothetical protein